VHRFRITLSGEAPAVAAAAAALEAGGAHRVRPREPGAFVWEHDVGWPAVEQLSRAHPTVAFGVEGFEDFQDELVLAVVGAGESSVLARQPLLPPGWGNVHHEEGQPLGRERLAAAARRVEAHEPPPPLFSGLQTALVVAEEAGRLAVAARDFLSRDAPAPETLAAVASFGRLALQVSASGRDRTRAELRYLLALRLTQAVLLADRDDVEPPEEADWPAWLGSLIGVGADVVVAAHESELRRAAEGLPQPPWPQSDPVESMELTARAALTTCLQVLALFERPS
jgi:hypothetical protein